MVAKFSHQKFSSHLHLPIMKAWVARRSLEFTKVSETFLPPTGFVIFFYSQPVCLGFIIKCDNGLAISTDFISDPDVPKHLRNDSVQELRRVLEADAKESGLKVLTAFTSIPAHVVRLKSLGYVEVDKNLTQLGRPIWP